MSSVKHEKIIVDLIHVTINNQEKMMELKEYKDLDQIPELKKVAAELNKDLQEGLELYKSEKAKLKKAEINDLLDAKQMKITNIFLTGTKRMMKIGDHDYAGLDRIMEWMKEEQKKLVI